MLIIRVPLEYFIIILYLWIILAYFNRTERPSIHVFGDKLVVVGGNDDTVDVDVYDTVSGNWSVVEKALKTSRSNHGATLADAKFFPECGKN